jgi:ligand-binding sensor domain-containing protein
VGILLACILLACCPGASALDPSFDVSQYAHTTWKVREGFTKGHVNSIAQTPDGYLWLATEFGLLRLDGIRTVPWQPPPGQHLPSSNICQPARGARRHALDWHLRGEQDGIQGLAEDADGALMIGMREGIRRFSDGKPEAYPLPGSPQHFRTDKLLRDRDGGLWIGTQHRGLVHVHQGRTDMFSPSDGLSSEDVWSLFEDREGSIWVAAVNGLDRFRDFAVATFSVRQGLSDALVWSVLADRNGIVWLGTRSGWNR